mmetsp:Transcript_1497/g.4658  ORF Transcript_1497/g.4658 Transcript_1497/m.4658 type:complete len:344 (-) Transcript_1497:291-1322(-)
MELGCSSKSDGLVVEVGAVENNLMGVPDADPGGVTRNQTHKVAHGEHVVDDGGSHVEASVRLVQRDRNLVVLGLRRRGRRRRGRRHGCCRERGVGGRRIYTCLGIGRSRLRTVIGGSCRSGAAVGGHRLPVCVRAINRHALERNIMDFEHHFVRIPIARLDLIDDHLKANKRPAALLRVNLAREKCRDIATNGNSAHERFANVEARPLVVHDKPLSCVDYAKTVLRHLVLGGESARFIPLAVHVVEDEVIIKHVLFHGWGRPNLMDCKDKAAEHVKGPPRALHRDEERVANAEHLAIVGFNKLVGDGGQVQLEGNLLRLADVARLDQRGLISDGLLGGKCFKV